MNFPVTSRTVIRLAVLSAAGFAAGGLIPAVDDASAATINISIAVIYAAIIATLLSLAVGRRMALLAAVRLELNKLRRLYHLSKNLSVAAPDRFRVWFTELHGHLQVYLGHFAGKDFAAYDASNPAFRKLSYHVYTLPALESGKETALFDDILRTTGSVSEARQHIKELWDNRLSGYMWVVVLLLTAAFVVSSAFATADTLAARVTAGAAFAVAFLITDLLWEIDTLSGERHDLANRYAQNLAKLELKRD